MPVHEKARDFKSPLELELQNFVSCPPWALATELNSDLLKEHYAFLNGELFLQALLLSLKKKKPKTIFVYECFAHLVHLEVRRQHRIPQN